MNQPAKSTIFAPIASCVAASGVRLSGDSAPGETSELAREGFASDVGVADMSGTFRAIQAETIQTR